MKQYPHTQWRMGPCWYCGQETYRAGPGSGLPNLYTRDHLIPKRLRRIGLQELPPNLRHIFTVTCCLACNKAKGQKEVRAFARNLPLGKVKRQLIRRAYSLNQRRTSATI